MTAMSALHRDGYLVLPDLLTPPARRDIRADLTPLLAPAGRDPFRSRHTRRVYGVLHNTRATDPLIDHPRVLGLVDRLLLPNFLLSQLEVVEVGAGAPARPPAHDDQHYPLPRPRPALSVAACGPSTPAPRSPSGRAATAGPPAVPSPPASRSRPRPAPARSCSAPSGTPAPRSRPRPA